MGRRKLCGVPHLRDVVVFVARVGVEELSHLLPNKTLHSHPSMPYPVLTQHPAPITFPSTQSAQPEAALEAKNPLIRPRRSRSPLLRPLPRKSLPSPRHRPRRRQTSSPLQQPGTVRPPPATSIPARSGGRAGTGPRRTTAPTASPATPRPCTPSPVPPSATTSLKRPPPALSAP
jgi:hypothetical protein